MRSSLILAVLIALSPWGCALDGLNNPSDGKPSAGDTEGVPGGAGQSGTEQPDRCVEVSRTEVTDTGTPADGFAYAANDMLDAVLGTWQGQLDGGAPMQQELSYDGSTISAIYSEMTSDTGETTDEECKPEYELTLEITVQSGSLLDEHFVVTGISRADHHLEVQGTIHPDDVRGTATPSFSPQSYDHAELALVGQIKSGEYAGFVAFRAGNEPEQAQAQERCDMDGISGCIDPESGECGACVGNSGTPGVFEPVGNFALVR